MGRRGGVGKEGHGGEKGTRGGRGCRGEKGMQVKRGDGGRRDVEHEGKGGHGDVGHGVGEGACGRGEHRLSWGGGRICGEWEYGGYMGRRGDMKEKRDMEKWRGGRGDMLGQGGERVGTATSGRTPGG